MTVEMNPPLVGWQCSRCRYSKIFTYSDIINHTWWDGHCCSIPDFNSEWKENVFRAIGNKNPNNDCSEFAEIKPEIKTGLRSENE